MPPYRFSNRVRSIFEQRDRIDFRTVLFDFRTEVPYRFSNRVYKVLFNTSSSQEVTTKSERLPSTFCAKRLSFTSNSKEYVEVNDFCDRVKIRMSYLNPPLNKSLTQLSCLCPCPWFVKGKGTMPCHLNQSLLNPQPDSPSLNDTTPYPYQTIAINRRPLKSSLNASNAYAS